jgi:hypothetical protein
MFAQENAGHQNFVITEFCHPYARCIPLLGHPYKHFSITGMPWGLCQHVEVLWCDHLSTDLIFCWHAVLAAAATYGVMRTTLLAEKIDLLISEVCWKYSLEWNTTRIHFRPNTVYYMDAMLSKMFSACIMAGDINIDLTKYHVNTSTTECNECWQFYFFDHYAYSRIFSFRKSNG